MFIALDFLMIYNLIQVKFYQKYILSKMLKSIFKLISKRKSEILRVYSFSILDSLGKSKCKNKKLEVH